MNISRSINHILNIKPVENQLYPINFLKKISSKNYNYFKMWILMN